VFCGAIDRKILFFGGCGIAWRSDRDFENIQFLLKARH